MLHPPGAPPTPLSHLSAFLRQPAGEGGANEDEGEGAAGLSAPARGFHAPVQREGGACGAHPPASTPEPPAAEPEAPPPPTGPAPAAEPEVQEEDQAWDPEEAPVSGRRASLSDLSSVDDIEALSVRQLKEILARNFVNYKGCCEKWELMERVVRLYQDQQNLQAASAVNASESAGSGSAGPEEHLCKICMDSPIDCVLLECGHMITCTKCGKRMSECPICRQYVVRAVHVFRS
ncbi:hypothetical protein CgunFtcFv8_010123 [Champsocephalus gunnari]|uniref:RING-type domain-containing protein n=1 Tax=Champsocephalus gunnari TaxID=52237 RepID=A0AAN8HZ61_CHAGU|nr:hypothetical protein CgunFtcFv8_010123 [Champsocephalus gunnari]